MADQKRIGAEIFYLKLSKFYIQLIQNKYKIGRQKMPPLEKKVL